MNSRLSTNMRNSPKDPRATELANLEKLSKQQMYLHTHKADNFDLERFAKKKEELKMKREASCLLS